jgi:hypothetical protein
LFPRLKVPIWKPKFSEDSSSDCNRVTLATEAEADEYLEAVLAKPEYCSMHEIELRADKHTKDPHVKRHFIERAKELLKSDCGDVA